MRAVTADVPEVMSLSCVVAMKVTTICIAVVPFMWAVIPVGITKKECRATMCSAICPESCHHIDRSDDALPKA